MLKKYKNPISKFSVILGVIALSFFVTQQVKAAQIKHVSPYSITVQTIPDPIVANQAVTLRADFKGEGTANIFGHENSFTYTVCAESDSLSSASLTPLNKSNPCGNTRFVSNASFARVDSHDAQSDEELMELSFDSTKLVSSGSNIDTALWLVANGVVGNSRQDTIYVIDAASSSTKISFVDKETDPTGGNNLANDTGATGTSTSSSSTVCPDAVANSVADNNVHLLNCLIDQASNLRAGQNPAVNTNIMIAVMNKHVVQVGDAKAYCPSQNNTDCVIQKIEWFDSNGKPLAYKDGTQPPLADQTNKNPIQLNAYFISGQNISVKVTTNNASLGNSGVLTDQKTTANLPGLVDGHTSTDLTGSDQGGLTGTGSTLLDFISKIISYVVLLLLKFIYNFFTIVLAPLISALLSIQVHTPEFTAGIMSGWVIVRNLTNIFFILAMIAIALDTLFDTHRYSYKELLTRLVLMALLVNFSLVIARVVLGIADTIQAQFIPANDPTVVNALAAQLMIHPAANVADAINTSNGFADIVASLTYLFFGIASFLTFAALAIFLVIRIAAIMILLMVSPIAYAGTVFGDKSAIGKAAGKWWGNFINYAFFTSIIAFFLNVASKVAVAQSAYLAHATQATFPLSKFPNFAQSVYNVLTNVVLIAFLAFGMYLAKSFDVYGADKILGKVKKYSTTPFKYGAQATRDYAERKKNNYAAGLVTDERGIKGTLKRGLSTALTPMKAWDARQTEIKKKNKDAEAMAQAAAGQIRKLRQSNLSVNTSAVEALEHKKNDEYKAKYNHDDYETLWHKLENIKSSGYAESKDGKSEIRGLVSSAISTGKLKDLIKEDAEFKNEPFNSETERKFLNKHLGSDPKFHSFLDDIADKAHESKTLREVGINASAGDGLSQSQAQDEVQYELVKETGPDKLYELKMSGMGVYVTDDNGKPIGPSKVYKEYTKKLAENGEIKITKSMMDFYGISGIDKETSALIFKGKEEEEYFRTEVLDKNVDLATRFYNTAAGADTRNAIASIYQSGAANGKDKIMTYYVEERDKDNKPVSYVKVDQDGSTTSKVTFEKNRVATATNSIFKQLQQKGLWPRAEDTEKGGKRTKNAASDDLPPTQRPPRSEPNQTSSL